MDEVPQRRRAVPRRVFVYCAATVMCLALALSLLASTRSSASSASPTTRSVDTSSATRSAARAIPEPMSVAPTTTRKEPAPQPEPVPMAIAPLTGLSVPASSLQRPAIVSKIDASFEAMPQVGLDSADLVYEVRIEWGSRYLGVWHSREPEIIGPHRSARTTDPDLLAMFGHPLFAFSGANDGVVNTLALSTWKTGVGPGEVPAAYFRDESRPWPHNLFARPDVLRTRKSPPVWPGALFSYRSPDAPAVGVPVAGFSSYPGIHVEFRWDPALEGWRRSILGREHLHATGAPVAPTNVVVMETAYRVSHADARSPEAISVGLGRAWVFSDGRVTEGTWGRGHRNDPWTLRDAAGGDMPLQPGSTWVVLAEGTPQLLDER